MPSSKKIKFFDVHCHIEGSEFDADREAVIKSMKEEGVWGIVVGTDEESSQKAVELAEKHEHLYAAIGVHPTDTHVSTLNTALFEKLVASQKVVAIGECGLDYYRMKEDTADERARQRKLFEEQLEFAVAHKKALMIHCRQAQEEMVDILTEKKRVYGDRLWGNIHFYTSTIENAKKYLELGFSLSFPGVITFTHDYDEVVRFVPENMILSETDTPFATPVPLRGTRNNPLNVKYVADKIAEIKGISSENMHATLVENAKRIFRIE